MTGKELEKITQEVTNDEANKLLSLFNSTVTMDEWIRGKKFRTCNARVIESKDFIALESYRTIVAFIYKPTGAFYDVLRTVYGYTVTSAQHIAKFRNDYRNEILSQYRTRYV